MLGGWGGLRVGLRAAVVTGPVILSTLVHRAGLTEAVPPVWLISTDQLVIGIGLAMRFRGMSHALMAQGIGMATLSVGMMLTLAALLAWGLSLTGERPSRCC